MALPRKIHLPAIGSLPNNIDPTLLRFCQAVKELIAVGEGVNTDHLYEKKITRRDLEQLGFDTVVIDNPDIEYVFPGAGPGAGTNPPAPINFQISQQAFSNRLSWTNPDFANLSSTNIFYSPDNSNWTLVGVITSPTSVFNHSLLSYYNTNQYYRIQSVSNEGLVSGFVTSSVTIVVKDTINELTDLLFGSDDYYTHQYNIIADSFLFSQPSEHILDWVITSNYLEGDLTLDGPPVAGPDGDPSNAYTADVDIASGGIQPSLNSDWVNLTIGELAGLASTRPLLKLGYVNSVPTMGLRGDFLVDGGLSARSMSATDIFTNHLQSVNYVLNVSGYSLNSNLGTAEFNNMTMILNWGTDVSGVGIPDAGATVGATWNADIADQPSDITIQNNLIDPAGQWVVGSTGTQGDFVSKDSAQDEIVLDIGPFGYSQPIWRSTEIDGTSNADGGWENSTIKSFDHTKTYRMSVFVKRNVADGVTYLGCQQTTNTLNLDGTVNINPYFWYGDLPAFNRWYLIVGILHGSAHGSISSDLSGVYDPDTGERVIEGTDFKSDIGATDQTHRAYLYDATDNITPVIQDFANPRIDEINGSELPLAMLMSAADVTSVNTSADTALVGGTAAATVLSDIVTAQTSANDAQATADGKVTTFYQISAPIAEGTGDLWVDTDDGNKAYRWDGSSWVDIQDDAIQTALSNASNAQATADGKIVSFYQTTAPTPEGTGDLWFDTDDNNTPYWWDGSVWISVENPTSWANVGDAAGTKPADNADVTSDEVDAGLDTTTGGLIVRDVGTGDYAHLYAGDLNFYASDGVGGFVLMKSVRDWDSGTAVNGETVVLPGYWGSTPEVILSPQTPQLYSAAYGDQDQRLNLLHGGVIEYPIGSRQYKFEVICELVVSAGITVVPHSWTDEIRTYLTDWRYSPVSDVYTVGANTTSISYTGSLTLYVEADKTMEMFGRVEVLIDGVWLLIYANDQVITGAINTGTSVVFNFSGITLPIPLSDTTYQFRAAVRSPQGTNQGDYSKAIGEITSITENHQGVTVSADGTVIWEAKGK